MIYVFVYGTLLTGESNHRIAEPYLLTVTPGLVQGKLVDSGNGYPALVLPPNTRNAQQEYSPVIHGEWLCVSEAGLAAMDELEGYEGPGENNDYDRVWIQDAYSHREGWIYVWRNDRGCKEIAETSWKDYRMQN
jgi:gamma-glutamylcyclotransferase (GGCT)/AIG2-like uncharacterized protein YtfP